MAPGCEPASVRTMMEVLQPLVLGQSLAGAGGGGFLYLLTQDPLQREEVLQVLNNTPVHTHIHPYTHIHIHIHPYTPIHIHPYTYTHTPIYTHTRTYTVKWVLWLCFRVWETSVFIQWRSTWTGLKSSLHPEDTHTHTHTIYIRATNHKTLCGGGARLIFNRKHLDSF